MANVFYCPLCGKEKGIRAYCVPDLFRRCQHDISQLIDTGMTDNEYSIFNSMDFHRDVTMLEALIELKKTDIIEYRIKIEQFETLKKQKTQIKEQEKNIVKCPKCSCTNIQVVPRKWSFWTGFLTNKTDRVCVKCGYKW